MFGEGALGFATIPGGHDWIVTTLLRGSIGIKINHVRCVTYLSQDLARADHVPCFVRLYIRVSARKSQKSPTVRSEDSSAVAQVGKIGGLAGLTAPRGSILL